MAGGSYSYNRFNNFDKLVEGAKPDFLDMDKDGNKKETFKKAVKDKEKGCKDCGKEDCGCDDKKEGYEPIDERWVGKHGQFDKEYARSRSQAGKMISGDDKRSGAEYTHGRRVKVSNPGMQPDVGGSTKPKSQGKMDKATRADLQYRKANLKKKVTKEDVMHHLMDEGFVNNEVSAEVLFNHMSDDWLVSLETAIQEGMHRDAKTGAVVKKAEIGKTYYPNMPKRKTSVAIRKEKG